MKKGKTFYSLLAFLTVTVLLCILFFSGLTIHATSNINLAQNYNITDCLTKEDFNLSDNGFVFSADSEEVSYCNDLISNGGLSVPDSSTDFNDELQYNNYLLWGGDDEKYYFFPCPHDSFLVVEDTKWGFDLYFNLSVYGYDPEQAFTDITQAYFVGGSFSSFTNMSFYNSNIVNIGGVDYGIFSNRSPGYALCLSTNCLITEGTLGVAPNSIPSAVDQINPDYSAGEDQGETAVNNLYLNSGYLSWSTPSTGYYKENWASRILANKVNWFKGTATFNYQLTSYQLEHPSEFEFRFTYWINYNVSQRVKTGTSDNYKNYGYSDNYGGNVFTVPFIDIYQNTSYNIQIDPLMNDFKSWYNNLIDEEYFMEIDTSKSNFTLKLKVEVVSGNSSGSDYTDTLNFITNHVTNNSNGITNNNYPYTDNNSGTDLATPSEAGYTNQTGFGNVPTTTGNNGSSTSGNNIVINNNNNRLIDPKPVVDYTKNELLPNESETNYVGTLENFLHADPFITLMSSTFTFVPVSVWSSLSTYITIMLSMLVAFFALRLILDIL